MATPRIAITFCTQCKWLLRAQWYQGELLQTFAEEVGEVALVPATGGVFRIDVELPGSGTHYVANRKRDGGFPDILELKRAVRGQTEAMKPPGHADRTAG
ncbi:SelT/SelW/SelH family protein [Zhihengliuella somnathii]